MGKIIAIGKLGRSIKFGRHLWKDGAGNNEPATLFSALANKNPENTYVLIGKSDFSRCKPEYLDYWFKHDNVIDAWKGFNSKEDDPTTYPYNAVKDMKFDYAIINGGIGSEINTKGMFKKYHKKTNTVLDEEAKPLGMFAMGVGPVLYFLNKTNVPWVNFTADARQLPIVAYDLFNQQKATLATIEKTETVNRFVGYGDQNITTREDISIYGMPELLCLLDPDYEGKSWFNNKQEKDIKVGFFFHKYKDKKRYNALKEYFDIFDPEDVSIFGKWEEEIDSGDERYKGSKTFDETQEILPRIKYTICYPIVKGDISAKWVESIRAGIVPFFDKDYDEDRLLVAYHKVPEFLYVSSPEEFKSKVEFLENNPSEYERLLNILEIILKNGEKDLIDKYQYAIEKLIYEK